MIPSQKLLIPSSIRTRVVIDMNSRNLLVFASVILITVLAALTLLFVLGIEGSAEDAPLHLNFKEDDQLIPETNTNPAGPYPSRMIEAQYSGGGPVRFNKQWVPIGTFSTEGRSADMNFTPQFLNVWYSIAQDGVDADPSIRFTIYIDGNEHYQDTRDFTDNDDGEIRELIMNTEEVIFFLGQNITFEVELEYSGYEDLIFYYDSATHDSGFFGVTDFLYVYDLTARGPDVTLEVGDIFGSNMENVSVFMNLSIDGEPINDTTVTTEKGDAYDVRNGVVNTTMVTWELEEPLLGGEEVEVWVKYARAEPDEQRGITKQVSAEEGNYKKPRAEITSIDPSPATAGRDVTFDASDSSDEDGYLITYLWTSNLDGEIYRGDKPIIINSSLSIGTHEISLRVRDNDKLWSNTQIQYLEIREYTNSPPAVTLQSPEDEASLDQTNIQLSWEGTDDDGEELTYTVYLDTQSDPQDMAGEDLDATSLDISDLGRGETYYWKVMASDGTDTTDSDIWSFSVEEETENTPPTVDLFYPGNGDLVPSGTVDLSWDAEDNDGDDLTFTVYLDTTSDPSQVIGEELTSPSLEVSDLEDGETYYWQVEAFDGTDSSFSDIWSFTMDGSSGNSRPTVTLKYPIMGEVIEFSSTALAWKGEDDDDDDLTYDVYLSTDPGASIPVATNLTAIAYLPDGLEDGSTYYWKIVVSDGIDTETSEIRQFTVDLGDDGGSDDNFIPGFGLMVFLVGVGCSGILVSRKRQR